MDYIYYKFFGKSIITPKKALLHQKIFFLFLGSYTLITPELAILHVKKHYFTEISIIASKNILINFGQKLQFHEYYKKIFSQK